MKFPPLDSVNIKDNYINATPDGEYALRILETYLEIARSKWVMEGLTDSEKLIYGAMNEHQDKRVEELDKAIAILRKELGK